MNKKHFISVLTAILILIIGMHDGIVYADLIWPIPEFTPIPLPRKVNYLVLVNKENALPENWEDEVELVHTTNLLNDDLEIEKRAYNAYLELKDALEEENIHVDLGSAYRSAAEQERIAEDLTDHFGEDYVKQHAEVPGFSEYQTGLALDLYLVIGGVVVNRDEDLEQYPEIWEKIHAKLPDFGFILRCPEGKEDITGCNYEPWHIRYLDNSAFAGVIMEHGLTLEEYLN